MVSVHTVFLFFTKKEKEPTTIKRLQFEVTFRLHDFFDNGFGPIPFPWQGVNGANLLVIGFPLVLEITSVRVVNVVLLGNGIPPFDARISML